MPYMRHPPRLAALAAVMLRPRAPTTLRPGNTAPVTQGTPAGNRRGDPAWDGRPISTCRDHKAHEHETPHQDHETRAAQRSRDRSEESRGPAASMSPPPAAHRRPPFATSSGQETQHRAMRYGGLPQHQAKDALGFRRGRIAAAVPRGLPRYRGRCPVAGAVGSATLASHFGVSLEDHGPNIVL
jgi:hypothetical protein